MPLEEATELYPPDPLAVLLCRAPNAGGFKQGREELDATSDPLDELLLLGGGGKRSLFFKDMAIVWGLCSEVGCTGGLLLLDTAVSSLMSALRLEPDIVLLLVGVGAGESDEMVEG